MNDQSFIIVLIAVAIVQFVIIMYRFPRSQSDQKNNIQDTAGDLRDKRMAELERQIELMRTKHDQMRLTMSDAVDKVERFAKRWIKREADETRSVDSIAEPIIPSNDRAARLANLRSRIRG